MCASKDSPSTQRDHHVKQSFCYNRPAYREARWERAVKVYTVSQESQYLIVQGVPSVGAEKDLVKLFALYGDIEEYRILHDYPAEEFTEVYLIKYKKTQNARFSKKKLDNRSFFGGILHVAYAPEYETVDETRRKLFERKRSVEAKIKEYYPSECPSKTKSSFVPSNAKDDVDDDNNDNDTINNDVIKGQKEDTGLQQSLTYTPTVTNHNTTASYSSTQLPFVIPPMIPPPYVPPPSFQTPSYSPYVPTLPSYLPPQMVLPPPPIHFPPNKWRDLSKAPSISEPFHRVPTKNASLPKEVQEAEDENAFRRAGQKRGLGFVNTSSPAKTQRKTPGLTAMERSLKPEANTKLKHTSTGCQEELLPKIIWKSTTEPTAWDPYKEQRDKEKSMTGLATLDKTADEIRGKLSKHRESIQPVLTDLYDVEDVTPTPLAKKSERKRI